MLAKANRKQVLFIFKCLLSSRYFLFEGACIKLIACCLKFYPNIVLSCLCDQ